jgi:hypothetical protein
MLQTANYAMRRISVKSVPTGTPPDTNAPVLPGDRRISYNFVM